MFRVAAGRIRRAFPIVVGAVVSLVSAPAAVHGRHLAEHDAEYRWILASHELNFLSLVTRGGESTFELQRYDKMLRFTVDEAEGIGAAFAEADQHWQALERGGARGAASKTIGRYEVKFNYFPEYDWKFNVRLACGNVTAELPVRDVKSYGELLAKARRRVEFYNRRITAVQSAEPTVDPSPNEFELDAYRFKWFVHRDETREIRVDVTPESTNIVIYQPPGFQLKLPPPDAVAVGAAMAASNARYQKLGDALPTETLTKGAATVVTKLGGRDGKTLCIDVSVSGPSGGGGLLFYGDEVEQVAASLEKTGPLAEDCERRVRANLKPAGAVR